MTVLSRTEILRRRIRLWVWLFIIGLFISGATAIPLQTEVHLLATWFGDAQQQSLISRWLFRVERALNDVGGNHPFLFYGTDWLAFGHFIIALVFVGALRDPVRNKWLFTFGLIACALVIPYAFVFGAVRGIPVFWRLIDCSFGVFGAIPLWLCKEYVEELERMHLSTPGRLETGAPTL
jgi:hypothetical protein